MYKNCIYSCPRIFLDAKTGIFHVLAELEIPSENIKQEAGTALSAHTECTH